MKILFLTPPMNDYAHYGDNVIPYTEYAWYAAYIREHVPGAETAIFECPAHRMTRDELKSELAKHSPDVVVIGILYAPQSNDVDEGFRIVKEYNQKVVTIAEGPHYGAIPEETLKSNSDIDLVVIGEAEVTLGEIVQKLMDKQDDYQHIDGIAFRNGEETIVTSPRVLIDNLDDLPMPAYDLMSLDKNLYYQFYDVDHYLRIYSSRGCRGRCSFCHRWPQYKGKYRTKSGQRMAEEILHLNENHGIDSFDIYDADFGEDPLMVKNLCTELVASGKELNIWFDTRADNVILWDKLNLIPLMKKAGVRLCAIGVEYYSDKNLKEMGKMTTTADIKKAFEILRRHNVPNGALAIIGWPEETRESAYKLYDFVVEQLKPDVFVLQMLQPLPGTLLWNQLKNEESLVTDYKYYNRFYPVMSTKYLSREEIGILYMELLGRFYSDKSKFEHLLNHENKLVRAATGYFLDKLTPVQKRNAA